MTPRPFQPADDGELYDALAHQDYRRSIQKPPPPASPWYVTALVTTLVLVLAGAAVIAAAVGAFSPGGQSTPSTPTQTRPSASARCEQAWLENRNNQYNMARSKAEYMTNCVDTQKALDQLREDHK